MNVKIRNKFIEIKYSVSNGLVNLYPSGAIIFKYKQNVIVIIKRCLCI